MLLEERGQDCSFVRMQFDEHKEVATKCDPCIERLENNELPACSKASATRYIFWANTNDLSKRIVRHYFVAVINTSSLEMVKALCVHD